jgi:hypothetical protein
MKKDRRVMLFEAWSNFSNFESLLENVTKEIKDVDKDVAEILKDLEKEGADEEDAKAAIMMQAMELADKGKDMEEIDIEKAKEEVKEGLKIKGKSLDEISESAGGVVHAIEMAGVVLGNAALLEFIAKKLQKLTGKKMDPSKMKERIEGFLGAMKKVTGLPGKMISKFFGWVAEKFGADAQAKKGAEVIGMGLLVVFLFGLGVMFFPLAGASLTGIIVSITGLIGKVAELQHIYKEIKELIGKAQEGDEKAAEEIGVDPSELENLAMA